MGIGLNASLMLILLLPLSVAAQGGSISSVKIVDSSTGGAVSGSVVSTGDSSSGAFIRNVITDTWNGTRDVHMEIRTESDGVIREESITKRFEKGEKVDIRIATSSPDSTMRSEARIFSGTSSPRAYASSTSITFFSWFGKYLPHASGTALHKEKTASSSLREVGTSSFSLFWQHIVDKLLTL